MKPFDLEAALAGESSAKDIFNSPETGYSNGVTQ